MNEEFNYGIMVLSPIVDVIVCVGLSILLR